MKYWIFVNNEIRGPFKLTEIVNSKYFSKDLLLCPYEIGGIKPSNWYFAKELPEFEPYLQVGNVIVENKYFDADIDIDDILEGGKLDFSQYEEKHLNFGILNKTDSILEERLLRSEKEVEEYKAKVEELEKKISKLQDELEKTLKRVRDYEDKLKERDREIEKLIGEISILKVKEDSIKDYERRILEKDKQIDELTRKLEEIEQRILKDNKETDKSDSKLEELKFKEDENLVSRGSDIVSQSYETLERDLGSDKEILHSEVNEDVEAKSLEKASDEISQEMIKNISYDDTKIVSDFDVKSFDPFTAQAKKLTAVNIEESSSNDEKEKLPEKDEIEVSRLKGVSLEKEDLNSIFQIADIKLEVVNSNLALVENKTEISKEFPALTSLVGNPQSTILTENETALPQASDNKIIETEESIKEDVGVVKDNIDLSAKSFYEASVNLNTYQREDEAKIEKEEKPLSGLNLNLQDKEKDENKRNIDVEEKSEVKKISVSSIYRKKLSPFLKISLFGAFIAVFAGSIVYILNLDSDKSTIKLSKENLKYPKIEKTNEDIQQDLTKEVVVSTETSETNEINVSKINENVKKSIDIVKGFDLGKGRGSIEKWFSNSFSNKSVKEEWNATYLSGSLFVVQYRVLRYKQEPIAYLFEVDVDKGSIVRGINNNAIELLSSVGGDFKKTQDNKRVAKSNIKNKQVVEQIKNSSEIF